ncbi:hypothetical protein LTR12_017356 [Friedmanniomyces endolithicus]|nr:hypothetical protein LTR12_017356 [Friedmanniomyces endolithicus]
MRESCIFFSNQTKVATLSNSVRYDWSRKFLRMLKTDLNSTGFIRMYMKHGKRMVPLEQRDRKKKKQFSDEGRVKHNAVQKKLCERLSKGKNEQLTIDCRDCKRKRSD